MAVFVLVVVASPGEPGERCRALEGAAGVVLSGVPSEFNRFFAEASAVSGEGGEEPGVHETSTSVSLLDSSVTTETTMSAESSMFSTWLIRKICE